jgi:endonuclease YncB( thermonuclease family)
MLFKFAPQMLLRIAMEAVQHSTCRRSTGQRDRLPARVKRLVAAFAVLTSCGTTLADDVMGLASVVDGDTLMIRGTSIRLWGVDAPKGTQLCRKKDGDQYPCGVEAANDLDTFIAMRPVDCNPIRLDRYGRTLATCAVGGADLGEWLVRNGLALDWPQYSKGRYGSIQREAKQAGRGMWKGSYVIPWRYRVCVRAGGTTVECSDDASAHP